MSAAGYRSRISGIGRTLSVLRGARFVVAMRPDKYARLAAAFRRQGATNTIGITISAVRCPHRRALVDELGELTYQELDERADSFAAALQELGARPQVVGIMCRNHRGFVEALAAADRIGADVLLLNTSFAGPALAEVVDRERPDVVVHDEEFTDSVNSALAGVPGTRRIVAWEDEPGSHESTVEALIASCRGRRPEATGRTGKLILLTSGTTGTAKGAKRSGGGGLDELTAVLSAVPWRAEETTVLAAPMFHAWGYGQLVLGTLLSCKLVVRRKFDAETTMVLVDEHLATGLSVVPVMIDRIVELPEHVRSRFNGRSLRFVTASGSRMRPDVVTAFMDRYGDVIYNNYNATEVGMIATASPADLRAAPDTAGRALRGVDIRILDENYAEVPNGEVGQIFARSSSHFDEYTSGTTKLIRDGYMASGDLGYFDDAGRLFVVGRDDEMIVSGGENVYPIEVERVLADHPSVAEAAVLGVSDEQFGQRLVAFVVPESNQSVTPEDLREHVRANLANFKVPRDITLVDELPRGSTGKILRRELQQWAGAGDEDA